MGRKKRSESMDGETTCTCTRPFLITRVQMARRGLAEVNLERKAEKLVGSGKPF